MHRNARLLLIAGLTASWVAFWTAVRPWYLRWGATDAEIARPMPLDDYVRSPRLASTMAITIAAPPERVWPWLVQIGEPPRAGYYSYTWIERMVGLRVVNRDTILPEHQSVQVGQALDKGGTMRVLAVEPGRSLVLGPPEGLAVRSTWAFCLNPQENGATRLVTRVRGAWSLTRLLHETSPLAWPFYALIEPGAFIMERRMLREIKRLAEAHVAAGK
jgi:hypothetical protein